MSHSLDGMLLPMESRMRTVKTIEWLFVVAALAVAMLLAMALRHRSGAHSASDAAVETTALRVDGMTCGSCSAALRGILERVDGVRHVRVAPERKLVLVSYDPLNVTPRELVATIDEKLPYRAMLEKGSSSERPLLDERVCR